MLREWLTRVRFLLAPKAHREIDDELQFHIERQVEANVAAGMTPQEARRQAVIAFGGVEGARERSHEQRPSFFLETLLQDLRYAIRMLGRSPGFTAVAVGSLALGIGANTVIFSLAKGVLLDRLTVPHPEQLRMITAVGGSNAPMRNMWGSRFSAEGGARQYPMTTYPIYQMLQQQNREHPVLGDIFAFKDMQGERLTATFDGHAEVVTAQMVSGNYYEQLGVRPQLGRGIAPADDASGSDNVMLISNEMWSRLFGRSQEVIGKTIQLNSIPMTIIGVNPPGFSGASSVQIASDVFFPLSIQPVLLPGEGEKDHPSVLDDKELWWTQVMARTRSDVPVEKAQVAVATWMEQDIRGTMKLEKDTVMPRVVLMDGSRGIAQANRNFSTQLYVLAALTGFVLLLACANLANLLLARSAARQREIAVRLALGASRWRVLRQVLTESLLLSTMGGTAGLALGYLGRNIIPHLYRAPWQSSALRVDFDAAILAFTVGISVLTGVLFGVGPAWQATRTPVNSALKDAAAASTRRRKGVAGRGLVVIQVALSMLLVVGAGLFASTLRNLYKEQLGFNPDNILLFSVQAPDKRYPPPKDIVLHQRIEERLARAPGVSNVTLSKHALIGDGGTWTDLIPTGQPQPSGPDASVNMHNVGHEFFNVFRIPLRYGRNFNTSDTSTSQKVAVINEALAQEFYAHENPLGKSFKLNRHEDAPSYQIVGVVADTKYTSVQDKPPATLYVLYAQSEKATEMTYEVKTVMPPMELLPGIRGAVAEIDKDLPLRDVRTQQAQIASMMSQQRTFAVLTGAFGVLALVLACIGIYGLMAYDVARRTSEIGVRMALGAQAGQMLRMILREASWLAVAGIVIGIGAALLLARFVRSMLYGLTPTDPLILTGSALLLLTVALLSGWGPARRASRTDPMEALRHE